MSHVTMKTDFSEGEEGKLIRETEEGGYVPGEGFNYEKKVETEELDVSYEELKKEFTDGCKQVDGFLG